MCFYKITLLLLKYINKKMECILLRCFVPETETLKQFLTPRLCYGLWHGKVIVMFANHIKGLFQSILFLYSQYQPLVSRFPNQDCSIDTRDCWNVGLRVHACRMVCSRQRITVEILEGQGSHWHIKSFHPNHYNAGDRVTISG